MQRQGKIKRLVDLLVWLKARDLAVEIYRVSGTDMFYRDFSFRDQIRRASISVTSNIAEGFGRFSNKEFAHFLSISSGSVSEVHFQILVAEGLGYINHQDAQRISEMCLEISKMIFGLRRKLI